MSKVNVNRSFNIIHLASNQIRNNERLLINKPYWGQGGTPPPAFLVLLGMRSVSDKSSAESQNKIYVLQFMSNKFYSEKSDRLRDNVQKHDAVEQITDDNIIRRKRIALWITTATDTHSEYFIIIAAIVTRTRINVTFI